MIKFIEAINTITNKKIKREDSCPLFLFCKRQVICWIENHIKKIDNYIEN